MMRKGNPLSPVLAASAGIAVLGAGLLAALSLGGCDAERSRDEIAAPIDPGGGDIDPVAIEPIKTFETESGSAEILDVHVDDRVRQVTIRARFDGAERTIVLEPDGTEPGWTGFRASIHGGVTFEFGSVWTALPSPRAIVYERTAEDELRVSLVPSPGGGRIEAYTWKGATRAFRVAGKAAASAELRREFQSFYPGTSSLETTVDGHRMVSLLASEAFQEWFTGVALELADRDPHPISREFDDLSKLCNWASGCVLLKCPFGGVANPICHACTGITIACFVVFVLQDVFGLV